MAIEKQYTIRCDKDGCESFVTIVTNHASRALTEARKTGWRQIKEFHICGNCITKALRERMQQ